MIYRQTKFTYTTLWNIFWTHGDISNATILYDYQRYYESGRYSKTGDHRPDNNPEFWRFIQYYVNRRIRLNEN